MIVYDKFNTNSLFYLHYQSKLLLSHSFYRESLKNIQLMYKNNIQI